VQSQVSVAVLSVRPVRHRHLVVGQAGLGPLRGVWKASTASYDEQRPRSHLLQVEAHRRRNEPPEFVMRHVVVLHRRGVGMELFSPSQQSSADHLHDPAVRQEPMT